MIELHNISIFTVCNVTYLTKVMVLAESVYFYNGIKTDVFIFDKKRKLKLKHDYCSIHWIEDEKIPFFNQIAFKYTVIELTTALKPYIALKLLKISSKVIFFDPDIMVFSSLNDIIDKLEKHSIIMTPHYFIPKINGKIDDAKLMRFGPYNLGFFGVNNSKKSKEFLCWWSERCISDGFDDSQFGIFTDQKWISIAPTFFPSIHTIYNPGYNVAFWNIDERLITKDSRENFLVNKKYPLLFFHFSSYNLNYPEKLTTKEYLLGKNSPDIISEISQIYSKQLKKHQDIAINIMYSFDFMSDGHYISPTLRRAYAATIHLYPKNHDPFDSKGVIALFAKKNHLFQRRNKQFTVLGYNSIESNTTKIKMVFVLMRLVLRIIGPNNFMNLSRLFVYLSSYHKLNKMWRC